GEALFHVARDPWRPFNVAANGSVVRAVGTEFSVRIRDPERVDVLVAEGRVAIGAPGTKVDFESSPPASSLQKVSAGQAAVVRRNSVLLHNLRSNEITNQLAWTEGRLVFQGETLRQAAAEFNRYNRRKIVIDDQSIADLRIGGAFSPTEP